MNPMLTRDEQQRLLPVEDTAPRWYERVICTPLNFIATSKCHAQAILRTTEIKVSCMISVLRTPQNCA